MKYFVNVLFVLFVFTSCEDVVDIDILQSEERVVFDAVVTERPGESFVKITRSVDYTAPNIFPFIPNASVTVEDVTNGTTEDFVWSSAEEMYVPATAGFAGQTGNVYLLRVVIGTSVYVSSEQLLKQVPPFYDDLGVYNEVTGYPRFGDLLEEGDFLFYGLNDAVKDGDHYRWEFTIDGEKKTEADDGSIARDEDLGEGDDVIEGRPIEIDTEFTGEPGEKPTITIELRQSRINKDIYEFWNQFLENGSAQGQPFAPPASELPSNMRSLTDEDEQVFGIFSAESYVDTTLVVNRR